ncbi:hypothetical protein JCM8097_000501 [Rhodosporidiobolus ruineniae]
MPDSSGAPDSYDYRSSSLSEDRRRARECEKRVEENRGRRRQQQQQRRGRDGEGGEDGGRDEAAKLIQGRYRSHVQQREESGMNLSSSQRWSDGMKKRRLSAAGREQKDGKNDPASRWQRAQVYTGQITDGQAPAAAQQKEGELSAEEEMDALARTDKERKKINKERVEAKQMEAQYWLEMVDKKHRYGSNLKPYHAKWNEEDTKENFFEWLDNGGGKDLDLDQVPRSRLESERIRYLSAEEREVYRVVVNDQGLLVWKKDGTPLDTSKYHDDRGPEHGGIVEISKEEWEEKERKAKERVRERKERGGESPSSSDFGTSSSSSSESSSDEADEIREGTKAYDDKGGTAGQGKGVRQFKERVKYYSSPRAVMDHLLRTTINKNTALNVYDRLFCHSGYFRWLYVSDLKNNLYVGIKKTGQFQHSSFLYGARVTSAGLIKASHGHLTSLSPLSGHYRAGTMHFKAFVRSLEEQGVDMSHVAISKSVLTIRGIEKYGRFTKKKKHLTDRIKGVFTSGPSEQEQEAAASQKELDRIRSEEKREGAEKHGEELEEGKEEMGRERRNEGRKEEGPLPGEGKTVEEMTEEERMERGIALVQRAFERGLKLRDDDKNDGGEKEDGGKEKRKDE